MSTQRLLINTESFRARLKESKIILIDGGARGDLFSPFDQVDPEIIYMIRFEPDQEHELEKKENSLNVKKALWSQQGEVEVHITKNASASSVYQPDARLLRQLDPHIAHRQVVKTITVACDSIDEVCRANQIAYPDFIKLDIHGSEYHALEGAAEALRSTTLGLLVESWLVPIYKGQKTRGDVEVLLQLNDFQVVEEFHVASWPRKTKHFSDYRLQPIACDSLFFKDLIDQKNIVLNEAQALKFIGFADLFGHLGLAMQLNNYYLDQEIISPLEHEFIDGFLMKKMKRQRKLKWYYKVIGKFQHKVHTFT